MFCLYGWYKDFGFNYYNDYDLNILVNLMVDSIVWTATMVFFELNILFSCRAVCA